MREGYHYTEKFFLDEEGNPCISIPEEIANEMDYAESLLWISNGNGTFTVIPKS